jgi:SAM-dependent methyltransferase
VSQPHGDVLDAHFADASLDLVLCLEALEHVDAVDRALAEFARVLMPGGQLVATVPFDETAAEGRRLACSDASGALRWSGPEDWHDDPVGARTLFPSLRLVPVGLRPCRGVRRSRMYDPALAFFGLWVLRARR